MSLFKFKSFMTCPYSITVKDAGTQLIVDEHACHLRKDHEGPHRSVKGAMWQNSNKIFEQRGLK